MVASTNITAANTPANPPHLTVSDDIPTPPCSTPLRQGYDATRLGPAHLTKPYSLKRLEVLGTLRRSGAVRSPSGLVDPRYGGFGIFNLYDQPSVAFVSKADHHRFLRVVHVPEYQLALSVEGARRDKPWRPHSPFHD